MKRFGLLIRLLIAIAIGIAVGIISANTGNFILVRLGLTFSSIFGNFLKYMIPIIIIGFVAPGIADLGRNAGRLLVYAALLAYVSAVVAGFAAFFIGSAVLPGFVGGEIEAMREGVEPYFTIGIPAIMDVMSALVTAFILGLGMAYLSERKLYGVVKDFQDIVSGVVHHVIIPLLPIHIAGIFSNMAATGNIARTLMAFGKMFALIIGLQLSYIVAQYLIAFLVTGKNPVRAIGNMLPAYFTALGTQSSAATIPVTLESAKNNGVSEEVADFVIPLGATIHLAGDTITLVIAAMTVMMISGATPTLGQMAPYIFMLGITMVAAPGIPGGGVYAALGLLENMLGFTTAQQSLMIALHFAQDSFGTATNVTGDGALALVIDKISDRIGREKLKDENPHAEDATQ